MDMKLHDNLNNNDRVSFSMNRSPYTRTRIVAGYDPYKDKNGITQFGEVVFETENMIVLGGSLFTLEKVFGVKSPLTIETLNDIMKIANTGSPITSNVNTYTCLFGVGIGGAGESITDVKDVKYYEREIMDMIPLRQTADELTSDEATKYWFRTEVTDANGTPKTAYYLKKFETEPEIHVLWRDVEGDEDGSEVGSDVYNTPESNTTPIETFIELTLKISKKDVREYFDDLGDAYVKRINSIGLFTGTLGTLGDGTQDYKDVRLFSKLNINNEILTLAKDLTIAYRIYTS